MKAHIIYYNYLTPDGSRMSIGGVQTYITNLLPILKAMNIQPEIYQLANTKFLIEQNGAVVHGCVCPGKYRKSMRKLFNDATETLNKEQDLLIFGCETCIVKGCEVYNTIAIQHGISWDVAHHEGCDSLRYLYEYILRAYRSWGIINRVARVKTLVCVDNNFINWFRALVAYPKVKLNSVLNFSELPEKRPIKSSECINIIFARRFFVKRGTRLFSNTIKRILEKYPDVHVTIAGEGPDEQYIHETLSSLRNIEYVKYNSPESLNIHSDKHIAVVPTLGSEGTSLSLLEAMASSCAVIATNVGGMTNIILDHYNGLLINPNEDELYRAIETYITDRDLMTELAKRGYETVQKSFSLNVWRNRWTEILKNQLMRHPDEIH